FAGSFGELHSHSGAVNAGALEFGQGEEAIEFEFDFGKGFGVEFKAEAVPNDVADSLTNVYDAEVLVAGDVETEVEGGLMAGSGGAGEVLAQFRKRQER